MFYSCYLLNIIILFPVHGFEQALYTVNEGDNITIEFKKGSEREVTVFHILILVEMFH